MIPCFMVLKSFVSTDTIIMVINHLCLLCLYVHGYVPLRLSYMFRQDLTGFQYPRKMHLSIIRLFSTASIIIRYMYYTLLTASILSTFLCPPCIPLSPLYPLVPLVSPCPPCIPLYPLVSPCIPLYPLVSPCTPCTPCAPYLLNVITETCDV